MLLPPVRIISILRSIVELPLLEYRMTKERSSSLEASFHVPQLR
jgi:hypothetical protein